MRLRYRFSIAVLLGSAVYMVFPFVAPIHESGHVVAAYLSGGSGWITGWNTCEITVDSPFIALAGQWFEAAILWVIGSVIVFKFFKAWGGFLIGASLYSILGIYRLTDYSDLLRMWPAQSDGAMALYWLSWIGFAFYSWLFTALTKEDRQQLFRSSRGAAKSSFTEQKRSKKNGSIVPDHSMRVGTKRDSKPSILLQTDTCLSTRISVKLL